ncbi:MAG TPA: VWA domain-containing protein [Candidatus Binatia bacterium]|nr:VWA domain-containing protein [Candidatus Binatia bacterium]
MIELAWPWALALLPLPLVVRRFWPAAPETRAGALRVPFFDAIAGIARGPLASARARRALVAAMALSWIALVVAAARPQWAGEPQPVAAAGRDLLLTIDLSGSMAREDFTVAGQPADRLTVVKEVADDFLARRDGDRVGLVLFGTRPYLQAPLTFDRETVRSLLGDASVGLAGEDTAIGDALALAVKRLKDRPAESRVVVLLTDGASNAGAIQPVEAAKLAAAEGVRVYTIGVGADRMAVSGFFGQEIVNPSADLDERTLREIADATGGAYFRAKNAEGLASIYRQIDALEPATAEPLYVRPTRQLFQWPLGVALALSLGIGLLQVAPSLSRTSASASSATASSATASSSASASSAHEVTA